jgi:hypothetical protein
MTVDGTFFTHVPMKTNNKQKADKSTFVVNSEGLLRGIRAANCYIEIKHGEKYCEACKKYRERMKKRLVRHPPSLVEDKQEIDMTSLIDKITMSAEEAGLYKKAFLLQMLRQLIKNRKCKSSEGFRYDEVMYHFAMTCVWFGGGALLKILRGTVIYDSEE